MTSDERLPNLMFLLALSPLVTGCPGDDSGTTSNSTAGTTSTTGMDTTAGPGTDTTGGGSGSASGDSTTDPGTTTTSPGTDTTAGSGDTTEGLECVPERPLPLPGPLCEAAADLYNDCYYDGGLSDMCIEYFAGVCQYDLEDFMMYSEECGMAFSEWLLCGTLLTCEELEMIDQFCTAEIEAFESECNIVVEENTRRPGLRPRR